MVTYYVPVNVDISARTVDSVACYPIVGRVGDKLILLVVTHCADYLEIFLLIILCPTYRNNERTAYGECTV